MTSDSGLAVIRSAVLIRAKKSHLANLARVIFGPPSSEGPPSVEGRLPSTVTASVVTITIVSVTRITTDDDSSDSITTTDTARRSLRASVTVPLTDR